MITASNGCILLLKNFLLISGISRFSLFAVEHTVEKTGTTENFQSVNTLDVIWNIFKLFCLFIETWHGCEVIAQS